MASNGVIVHDAFLLVNYASMRLNSTTPHTNRVILPPETRNIRFVEIERRCPPGETGKNQTEGIQLC